MEMDSVTQARAHNPGIVENSRVTNTRLPGRIQLHSQIGHLAQLKKFFSQENEVTSR